jgi:hypothetical protein
MEENKKTFVGEKKIKRVDETELKTPAGGSIVNVVYDNNDGEELMTLARLESIRTFKKSDSTKARDRLVHDAGRKLYALLMEYGPYLYEVDHILNEAVRLANHATEQATDILWGKDHPSKRSLLDVNNILAKHYGKYPVKQEEDGKEDDGSTPERSAADNADSDESEVRKPEDSN